MKTKLISVFLCLCLLVGILPLTAFAAQTYSITYDANGGSLGKGTVQTYGGLDRAVQKIESLTPTMKGYTFLGWSTDPKATAASYSSDSAGSLPTQITLTSDSTTLYAVWEAKVEKIRITGEDTTLRVGKTMQLEAVVTLTGEASGDPAVVWSSSDPTVAVVGAYTGEVLALSSGTVTITAGTANSEKYATYGLLVKSSKTNVETIQSNDRKKGITLSIDESETVPDEDLDWVSTDPGVLLVNGTHCKGLTAGKSALYAFDDDGTVWVYWVEVCATITLDYNGGKFRRSTVGEVQTENGYVNLSTYIPTRSGYVFVGWARSADADKASDAGVTAFTTNTTLYALWQREPPEEWCSKFEVNTDWYYDAEDEDTFYLSEPEELAGLAWLVNKEKLSFVGCTIYLMKDLYLMGSETAGLWTPIGTENRSFCGTLDGGGHTIYGLFVRTDSTYAGLFGNLGGGAAVQNLGLTGTVWNTTETVEEGKQTSYTYSGSVAGYAERVSIENCWSTVNIHSGTYAGGLVGRGDTMELRNCWYAGTLTGAERVGALFGEAHNCDVDSCYYTNTTGSERFAYMDYGSTSPADSNMEKNASVMQTEQFTELLNSWVEEQDTEEGLDCYTSWGTPEPDSYPDFVESVQWNGKADTAWYKKDGVTFTITTTEELAGLALLVNAGTSFKGQEVLLGADLYVGKQQSWTPIGTENEPFQGIFDGRGHVIEAVRSDRELNTLGLFGVIDGAMICNLGLRNCSFESSGEATVATVAAIAGNSGIVNCWSNSDSESKQGIAGGLVGVAEGSNLLNCWFAGSVDGRNLVGAIAGKCISETQVSNCYYIGNSEDCAEQSDDSVVSCEKLTVRKMQGASFAENLNAWLESQNSEQYYSWRAQAEDYPTFGELIVPVSAVTLDQSSLRMELGKSVQLTASVLPENTTYGTVVWESSDPEVATVENGVVRAVSNGVAEITAKAGNKNGICRVKVGADDLEEADNDCYAREFTGSGTFVKLSQKREITAGEALELCDSLGFTGADSASSFSFQDTDLLTREMACELICKQILGQSDLEAATTGFRDVPANRWSSGYVARLLADRILSSTVDEIFQPDTPITGTEFCELLLGGIGRLDLDGKRIASAAKALDEIQYHIYLDSTRVNPKTVLSGTYQISGVLVRGLAQTGVEIAAELLENTTCTTYLKDYTGQETGTMLLSAADVSSQYTNTKALSAYAFSGIEDGAITGFVCEAKSMKAGETAEVVLYLSNGAFSGAKDVKLDNDNEVSFTVKIFGVFVVIPKDQFETSEWNQMGNFQKTVTYGGFEDVDETLWYGSKQQGAIQTAVELGIMNGYADGNFQPTGNIKLSEVVKMAAVVRNIYQGGSYVFDMNQGDHWYDTYVNYCIDQGILQNGDFKSYEAYATRAEMAYIFAKSLPTFASINEVTYDQLPDVTKHTVYAEQILALYCAGVLTGDAGTHAYRPTEYVNRAEAAAIIARVALTSERQQLTF